MGVDAQVFCNTKESDLKVVMTPILEQLHILLEYEASKNPSQISNITEIKDTDHDFAQIFFRINGNPRILSIYPNSNTYIDPDSEDIQEGIIASLGQSGEYKLIMEYVAEGLSKLGDAYSRDEDSGQSPFKRYQKSIRMALRAI